MSKIIARGAEAVIIKRKNTVIKQRVAKGYRHTMLDEKLRKLRTRAETKLLAKAGSLIHTPKILSSDETNKTIELQYIAGKKLADCLEKQNNIKTISLQIGQALAKLHDADIIHGDLTTSNMMLSKENKIYFIDFGLGFSSHRIEDKATDLHVLKEALEAKHPSIHEKVTPLILQAYKKASKHSSTVLKQLEKVELRGRYKAQY